MPKKNKNKGRNFERHIAKLLSDWSGVQLRRTPLSGGWSNHPDVSGDIVCEASDANFPIHIECKNNESWSWKQVLKGTGPVFSQWWVQTLSDCIDYKYPLLIFSRAYQDIWLLSDGRFLSQQIGKPMNYVKLDKLVIMGLDDFMVTYPYVSFIHILEVLGFGKKGSDIRQSEGGRPD